MLTRFGDWAINRHGFDGQLQLEVFSGEGIMKHKPKDAMWSPDLSTNNGSWKYYFNVEGDDCGSPLHPCYYLSVNDSGSGASISFSRNGSYADSDKGVAGDVFMGVLKGLGEFIETRKPVGIGWSAIDKDRPNKVTGKIENPRAREHIYEGWAMRNLFPDKYVPLNSQKWVRRDIYDSEFVANQGFPQVPGNVTGASSPSEKKKAYDALASSIKSSQEEISRRREEARLRAEQERIERERREEEERQARLDAAIVDPTKNPKGIKVGDIVNLLNTNDSYWESKIGKIISFELDEDALFAQVQFYDGDDMSGEGRRYNRHNFPIDQLSPETEESKIAREERVRQAEERRRAAEEQERREAEERLQTAIQDREKNPDDLKVGDTVITYVSPTSRQNGLVGTLKSFEMSYYGRELLAKIEWDERSSQEIGEFNSTRAVSVKHLRKNTPDVAQRIEAEIRRHHQEELISRQREREDADRTERETLERNAASTAELVNDTENNPQGLKVGDHVKVTGGWPYRNVGRSGYIVLLRRAHWGNEIQAEIRFNNSRASSTTSIYLRNLARDESEETQRIAQRRQQRQQRAAAVEQSVQGFAIGDTVIVTSGINRNKTGRILRFQGGTQGNVRAVMLDSQNNQFTANIRTVQKVQETQTQAS
jgi:preprotein translocase subunit YajC